MRTRASRQRARQAGNRAEAAAALWLRLKGYRIAARNYRTAQGEVDILARRGAVLAAVEVKYRPEGPAAALAAVPPRAQQRIAAAAAAFQARSPRDRGRGIRFDVAAIRAGWPPIRHIVDAWRV